MNSINFAGTSYTEKSLAALSSKELVALYNAAATKQGSNPTKRFSSIGSGLTRTWNILKEVGEAAAPAKPAPKAEPTASLGTTAAPKAKKPQAEPRATRGTNRAAPGHAPLACREGSKQALLLDQLARPEGASMAELLAALSGGNKPWTEATVHSGFGWDMKLKGYGVRSEVIDGVERFFIVLPPKGKIPAHTPLKGVPKADARQAKLKV